MKDEVSCMYCMYKRVPSGLPPCNSCKNDISEHTYSHDTSYIQQSIERNYNATQEQTKAN